MIDEVKDLFMRQVRTWPPLAQGVEGLARASTRRVRIDWYEVFIRHIPHRVMSTTARVDQESIAKRPCFLCTANLPREEEGLQFDSNFIIYCNPFPIVDCHLTIAHREHTAQRIANRFGQMLAIAAALPGFFIIYNGPECGASAPDHMHFQAGSRRLFPIEKQTNRLPGFTVPHYDRNVFLFRGQDASLLAARLDYVIDLLAEVSGDRAEPMVNIAVFHEKGEWVAYVFPRSKHRPDVFYTGELTVSPASIDLCGIFVVPLAADFERITGSAIAAIFQEITLADYRFQEVVAGLRRKL